MSRERQLEAALRDFFAAACKVSCELNLVCPFVPLAVKHAHILRNLPLAEQENVAP
jgi:hypothetical protein